ncbi:MAG: tetratricopeptide repeat protein, partial [Pyrinomonadaceae bacterium]
MIRRATYISIILLLASAFSFAQGPASASDVVLVLPFENTSNKNEFNWVGESFADSLSDLLKVPTLTVLSNEERKVLQQRLRIPLTTLPSLATSLKLAREANATLLISGKYTIIPAGADTAATINVTAKLIRVNEGRFMSETIDGRQVTRDITLTDALGNLQTIQGQIAYQILYQRDKALPYSQNQLIEAANKVPARAFEAYIKGLLTPTVEARENYFKNASRLYSDGLNGAVYSEAELELGHLYLATRKFNDAIASFERVISQNQRCREKAKADSKPAMCRDEAFAEASFYIGLIFLQQGNFESAIATLRPLTDDLKLTTVYNALGAIAVQGSRAEKKNPAKAAALLAEGIGLLKKAADSAPEDATVRFNYATALFLNGNLVESAEQMRSAIVINPKDGEAYYILAKILESLKDPTAADMDNQARRFLTDNNRYANLEKDW